MDIDLIIPTFNRSELLQKCLHSVVVAKHPAGLNIHVMVVDNNSTDNTRETIRPFLKSEGLQFSYCFVSRAGKSAAVNEAIARTTSEMVGFIDDDELMDSAWFEVVLREFSADTQLEYIGGPCLPNWEIPEPDWFPWSMRGVVAIVPREKRVRFSKDFEGILMGGNIAIKRATLQRVLPYPEQLGKIGNRIRSGMDEIIYHRLLGIEAKGMVIPELIIYHWIPRERLTKQYFRKWAIGRGIGVGFQFRERGFAEPALFGLPRYRLREALRDTLRMCLPVGPGTHFEAELSVRDYLGMLYGRHIYGRKLKGKRRLDVQTPTYVADRTYGRNEGIGAEQMHRQTWAPVESNDRARFSARISEAVAWRGREAQYSLRLMAAKYQLFASQFHKRRPHTLSAPLVVSVTSYRPRFGILAWTLKCLLRQTILPDHTILWVTEQDYRHLPCNVLSLQKEGLEIKTAPDTRSYKKILPAVALHSKSYLCTADDDLYYWPTWLEELVAATEQSSQVVPCHRAHEMTLDEKGMPRPYRQWTLDSTRAGHHELLFPTSGAGVLYSPGILKHTREDEAIALRYCASADDIWLFWICRRNGARFKMTGKGHNLLAWRGSQNEALWYDNMQKGGNDRQIASMCSLYGFPPSPNALGYPMASDRPCGTLESA